MHIHKGTRALITGGGSGLGRAIALEVARRGGRVLVADVDLKGAEETVREVRALGGEAIATPCDVTQIEDFERAVALIDARFGGVDLLVNNAGVAVAGPVGGVPLADWRWIIDVNLLGVVHGCHLLAPRFQREGRGHILNVASAAGLVSSAGLAPYNVTKAAVVALSETLHQELSETGAGVSVLCPTFFATAIVDNGRHHNARELLDLAKTLMRRSKLQAPDVARAALDGVENGELYVVPMSDGRWMWRVKRLWPEVFYGKIAPKAQGLVRSQLAKAKKAVVSGAG